LVTAVWADLSLPAVIAAMVGSGEAWIAVSSFCGSYAAEGGRGEGEAPPQTGLETGATCFLRTGVRPHEGGGTIAPITLPALGEDDLARGVDESTLSPPAEGRGGCRHGEALGS